MESIETDVSMNGGSSTAEAAATATTETAASNADTTTSVSTEQTATAVAAEPEQSVFDRLWAQTEANPTRFDTWTKLLAEAERLSKEEIERPRQAFDRFLERYPLCFGYWKKYADAEWRQGKSPDKDIEESAPEPEPQIVESTIKVYERGVQAVPHSPEHWMNYFAFARQTLRDTNRAREVAKRAVDTCYLDPKAEQLWSAWIDLEVEKQEEDGKVRQIYEHAFGIDMPYVENLWNKFSDWAKSSDTPLLSVAGGDSDLLTSVRAEVDAAENAADMNDEDKETNIRAILLGKLDPKVKESTKASNRRRPFEAKVGKRTYYHVNALDSSILRAWDAYLDDEEKHSTTAKIQQLYERCLVPTANYAKFFLRYARWLRKSPDAGGMDGAIHLLRRATSTFVPQRPETHLMLAHFLEEKGDEQGAREAYESMKERISGLLVELIEQHAAFERRAGDEQRARQVYAKALEEATAPAPEGRRETFSEIQNRLHAGRYVAPAYIRFLAVTDAAAAVDEAERALCNSNGKYATLHLWASYISAIERKVVSQGAHALFEAVADAYHKALRLKSYDVAAPAAKSTDKASPSSEKEEKPKTSNGEKTETAEAVDEKEGTEQEAADAEVTEVEPVEAETSVPRPPTDGASRNLTPAEQAQLWLRYVDFCILCAPDVQKVSEAQEAFSQWKDALSNVSGELAAVLGIDQAGLDDVVAARGGYYSGSKRGLSESRDRGGRYGKSARRW